MHFILGRDVGAHPNNPKRQTAANAPSIDDILCNKNNKSSVPDIFFESQQKKGKAKRHLIHKPRQEEPDKVDVKVKCFLTSLAKFDQPLRHQVEDVKTEEVPVEPPTTEVSPAEEEVADEQTVEMMKDIWYKAGEMDEEELDALEADEQKKKTVKGRKPKNGVTSSEVKLKRVKTEPAIKRIRKTATGNAGSSTTSTEAKVPSGTTPKKPAPLPELLNQKPLTLGFKIPKKALPGEQHSLPEASEIWRDPQLDAPGSETDNSMLKVNNLVTYGRRDSGSITQTELSDPAELRMSPESSSRSPWSHAGPSKVKCEHLEAATYSPQQVDQSTCGSDAAQQRLQWSTEQSWNVQSSSHDDPYDPNKKRSRKQKSPRFNRGQPERFHSSGDGGVSSNA